MISRYILFDITSGLPTVITTSIEAYEQYKVYGSVIAVGVDEVDLTEDIEIMNTWHWMGDAIGTHSEQPGTYWAWDITTWSYIFIAPAPVINVGAYSTLSEYRKITIYGNAVDTYWTTSFPIQLRTNTVDDFATATVLTEDMGGSYVADNIEVTSRYYYLTPYYLDDYYVPVYGTTISTGSVIPLAVETGDIGLGAVNGTKLASGAVNTQLSGTGVNVLNPRYTTFEEGVLPPFTTHASGTLSQDATAKYFGTKSLKIVTTGIVGFWLSPTKVNNITPNKKWILSCYVYSDTIIAAPVWGTAGVHVGITTASAYYGTNYYDGTTTSTTLTIPAGTWTRIYGVLDLTADSNTTCDIRLDSHATGKNVWFDGIMLEAKVGDLVIPSVYQEPVNFLTTYTGDLGATRNVFKGNWVTATAYVIGDVVIDTAGYGWSCISAHTSSVSLVTPTYPTTSNTYWTIYTVKGGTGATGPRATFTTYAATGTLWTSGATYIAGQQIYYGLNWYTATAGTSGTVAPIHALGTVTATGGTATFAYATPPTWTANVDTVANTAITSMVGSAGVIIVGDEVTICWPNTTSPTYVLTKYASAVGSPATTATWTVRGQVIDGNLMVTGTLSAASLKTSNLSASTSITVGTANDGLILSSIDNTLRIKKSGSDRVTIGNLGTTYGVQGLNLSNTEIYRLDEDGLLAYPRRNITNTYGSSYNYPILQEGTVTLNNSITAGTITQYVPLLFSTGGAFKLVVQAVGYAERLVPSTTTGNYAHAASCTMTMQIYYKNNANSNLAGVSEGMGRTIVTSDSTNNTSFAQYSNAAALGGAGFCELLFNSLTTALTDADGNIVPPESPYLRLTSYKSQATLAVSYIRYITWGMDDGAYPAFDNQYGV